MPARDAADRLASLQGFFDKANLLVVTPSPPTLGAQHIDLHSPGDLKARLKVKSSARQSNYTRRPPPGGYCDLARVMGVLALFSWDRLLGLVNPEPNSEEARCLLLPLPLDDPQDRKSVV